VKVYQLASKASTRMPVTGIERVPSVMMKSWSAASALPLETRMLPKSVAPEPRKSSSDGAGMLDVVLLFETARKYVPGA